MVFISPWEFSGVVSNLVVSGCHIWQLVLSVAWSFGVQLVNFISPWEFSGVVSQPSGLRVSQYVVSVESSSLTHHRPYYLFVNFLCRFIDGLENLHADRMFQTSTETKSENSDPVKHV